MTRLRERIFAGFGAALFFITASALTVFVVFNFNGDKAATTKPADATACTDTQTEPTLAAPEVYKPEGAVTALQSTDLEAGSGAAAKNGDCLVMKYYGTLATDGTMFDENFTKTTGFAFKLGGGQVIAGWDQGLVGLKVGGTRRLAIPAALGYGSQSPGASIPANSDLVFVVKLLRIQ